MRSKAIIQICIIGIIMIYGCKRKHSSQSKETRTVVATTGMLADAAKQIGGSHVNVQGLMGPGVDPHLYKATANDAAKLSSANLIFYNGLHLEGKMQSLLEKMAKTREVVSCTDEIPKNLLRKPPSLKGFFDPHVWFDVSLWIRVVQRMTRAMIKTFPKEQSYFRKNSEKYIKTLHNIHTWIKKEIQKIPLKKRYLVTSHDAFGYFGDAYGVNVIGLQGVSTVAEAGIKDVERVISLLVKTKLSSIFVESSISKRSIEAVIQGCKGRGHHVKIGGHLFSDAMGEAGTAENSYIGMIKHNVSVFVHAFLSQKKRVRDE